MVDVRISESTSPDPWLPWDTVWDARAQRGDWAQKAGGLQAESALATAVTLCLFTDRRVPPEHPLAKYADGDPRGWWGDGVDVRADLGETELGSYLWLLERAPLTEEIRRWAESMAQQALATLVLQGAVARIDVRAEIQQPNRLNLGVWLYARDGARLYDQKFDLLWRQVG